MVAAILRDVGFRRVIDLAREASGEWREVPVARGFAPAGT
jgi:hypothetical protein